MELTLSDVGAVNISQVIGDGTSVNCVTGEDGVWSLTT